MSVRSLVALSIKAAVQNDCIIKGCDLGTLPRSVLQDLLLASISQSRMLCLRSLITNWPMKHLVLHNVSGLDAPKATLLADCLQWKKHDLQLVDLRGCNIGVEGTTAFFKLALGIPVVDCNVSGINSYLDVQPSADSGKQNLSATFPCQKTSPMVVILDCVVCRDNCDIALKACVSHSVVDLKMSHLIVMHRIGRKNVQSLLLSLEPEIVTGLHIRRNALGIQGINESAPVILTLTNITYLTLTHVYRGLHVISLAQVNTKKSALQNIESICGNLTKLKKLDLSGNEIKCNVVAILQSLQSPLTHLALGDCGLKDSDLHEMCTIENLGHLEYLNLNSQGYGRSHEVFSAFVLKSAATLKSLTTEDTHYSSTCSSIVRLFNLVRKLPLLIKLSLSCIKLSPDCIRAFKKEFPTVELLNTYCTKSSRLVRWPTGDMLQI